MDLLRQVIGRWARTSLSFLLTVTTRDAKLKFGAENVKELKPFANRQKMGCRFCTEPDQPHSAHRATFFSTTALHISFQVIHRTVFQHPNRSQTFPSQVSRCQAPKRSKNESVLSYCSVITIKKGLLVGSKCQRIARTKFEWQGTRQPHISCSQLLLLYATSRLGLTPGQTVRSHFATTDPYLHVHDATTSHLIRYCFNTICIRNGYSFSFNRCRTLVLARIWSQKQSTVVQ